MQNNQDLTSDSLDEMGGVKTKKHYDKEKYSS